MQNEPHDIIFRDVAEGVLLPAAKLSLIKRSHDIIAQAKKNASRIIKEAEAECERIRRESYMAGFEQGLVMSLGSVCQYIDNSEQNAHEMEIKLRNDLRTLLSDIISEDDFNIKVVEHWAEGIDKSDQSLPLHILMPYANRRLKERFAQAIKKQYSGAVIFEFHEEPRFVFKYNNRLAEFYPEEFVNDTVDTLASKYTLAERTREISNEAIRYLHEQLSLLYPSLPEEDLEELPDEQY